MTKKAVKLTVSEELFEFFQKRSKETGLSVPALALVAMDMYKREYESKDSE